MDSLAFRIIYQVLGIVALIICVISFQFKKKKTFLLMQCGSSIFFAIQFFIGQAWVAFFMNCLCIIRSLLFYFFSNKKVLLSIDIILDVCFTIIAFKAVIIFNEKLFIALVCLIGSIAGTISYLFSNKTIRIVQICIVSPCWLVNNIYYFSIGAIISECFNIISSITALIRWKYEKNKSISLNK